MIWYPLKLNNVFLNLILKIVPHISQGVIILDANYLLEVINREVLSLKKRMTINTNWFNISWSESRRSKIFNLSARSLEKIF
jgi:hypothetical protein